MTSRAPLLCLVLLLGLAAPVTADDDLKQYARIHFGLTLLANELPDYKECDIIVWTPGWNTIQLLDNATQQTCIGQWSWESAMRNVRCIDRICTDTGWQLFVNESARADTFWKYNFNGNESVEFVLNDQARIRT